jgi:hypothetical protein
MQDVLLYSQVVTVSKLARTHEDFAGLQVSGERRKSGTPSKKAGDTEKVPFSRCEVGRLKIGFGYILNLTL